MSWFKRGYYRVPIPSERVFNNCNNRCLMCNKKQKVYLPFGMRADMHDFECKRCGCLLRLERISNVFRVELSPISAGGRRGPIPRSTPNYYAAATADADIDFTCCLQHIGPVNLTDDHVVMACQQHDLGYDPEITQEPLFSLSNAHYNLGAENVKLETSNDADCDSSPEF
jgi:hypothetical protein